MLSISHPSLKSTSIILFLLVMILVYASPPPPPPGPPPPNLQMGALKQKWAAEEEEALIAGINKHGTGKWKKRRRDPQFSHVLAVRSNIDLKDKWRNMSVSATGEGSRPRDGKAAVIKPKVPKTLSVFQYPPSSSQATEDANDKVLDPTKNTPDRKQPPPRYNAMILETVSNITDPNGADIGSINDFVEQRHEVPSNFRRLLSSNLRRLVAQEKLEKVQLLSHETKVQTYYKIKKDETFGTKAQTPKPSQVCWLHIVNGLKHC
ncbi:hypothetical protein C5167_031225 [Papaver somniferum]|uniref:telomere repeat-binding factor 4-like n=1 Tax=Papaver somniferum TaxID=3469 RepID=UPI000E6FDA13|nr:telomere repeat-binding factor 4-like [Papaver somniferum]RZC88856.1 hypothetical protein C5167_031225 [Papaver somniferum]